MTYMIISALLIVIALLTLHGFWLGLVIGACGYYIGVRGVQTMYALWILRGM